MSEYESLASRYKVTEVELVQKTPFSMDIAPDGTIESFSWSFGDGTTSNQPNPTHKYSSAGKYTVTLTIVDNGGKNNSYNSVIKVGESTPGFELIFVLFAIGIVCILLSKKKFRYE